MSTLERVAGIGLYLGIIACIAVPFDIFPRFDDWRMVVLVAIATGWALMMSGARFRESRMVRDLPTSKIRSAAQGYVELIGRAAHGPDGAFYCPIGDIECVWCDYSIREKKWFEEDPATVASETTSHAFLIEDSTGRCLVHPSGARVVTRRTYVWYGSTPRPRHVPERLERALTRFFLGWSNPLSVVAYLLTFGVWYLLAMTLGRFRYEFSLIEPGEPLYALGAFNSAGGQHLLGPSGDATQPFILSTRGERQLASGHARQALAYFAAFVGLGLLLTVLMLDALK